MEEEDTMKFCDNCKREIAIANFQIHEIHCRRKIVLCEHCGEPVPRSGLDEHYEDNHTDESCDLCGQIMEKYQIDQHMEDECPEREIYCEYCDLYRKAKEYEEHLSVCSSRTDECFHCKKRIMLRYMADHHKNDCVPLRLKASRNRKVKKVGSPQEQRHAPLEAVPVPRPRERREESSLPLAPGVIPQIERTGEFTPVDIDSDELVPRIVHGTSLAPPLSTVAVDSSEVPTDYHQVYVPAATGPDDYDRQTSPEELLNNNQTFVFDREWINSVANAVQDDRELDRILANTMNQEYMRKNENLSEDLKRKLTVEDDVHVDVADDAEYARRLQEEFDRHRHVSLNDAAIAKNMGEGLDQTLVDSILTDKDGAHRLYDNLEEVEDEDDQLAQQLQQEERFADQESTTELSTMMIYDRSKVFNEQQQEQMKQLENDHELAAMMQQQHEEGMMNAHYYPAEYMEQPVGLSESYEDASPYHERVSRDTPSPVMDTPASPPPPDDQGIPCEMCGTVVDFDQYQIHLEESHPQFLGYASQFKSHDFHYQRRLDPPPFHNVPHRRSSPSPPPMATVGRGLNHIHGYGVSSYEKQEDGVKAKCDYCGFSYHNAVLQGHMLICDENPDKNLKSAYQKPAEEDIVAELKETIPCEFCRESIPLLNFSEHQEECKRNARATKGHRQKDTAAMVSCQHCGDLVPIHQMYTHEISCGFRYRHTPSNPAVTTNTALESEPKPVVNTRHLPQKDLLLSDENSSLTKREKFDSSLSLEYSQEHKHQQHTSVADQEEEEVIPCQFCEKSFPVEQISDHQDECRFSVHGIRSFKLDRNSKKNADKTLILCTTCSEKIPLSEIHKHQIVCEYRVKHTLSFTRGVTTSASTTATYEPEPEPERESSTHEGMLLSERDFFSTGKKKFDPSLSLEFTQEDKQQHSTAHQEEEMIPCQFCHVSLPVYQLSAHQQKCRLTTHGLKDLMSERDKRDRPTILCIHCNKQIPLTELHEHQELCIPGNKVLTVPPASTSINSLPNLSSEPLANTSISTRPKLLSGPLTGTSSINTRPKLSSVPPANTNISARPKLSSFPVTSISTRPKLSSAVPLANTSISTRSVPLTSTSSMRTTRISTVPSNSSIARKPINGRQFSPKTSLSSRADWNAERPTKQHTKMIKILPEQHKMNSNGYGGQKFKNSRVAANFNTPNSISKPRPQQPRSYQQSKKWSQPSSLSGSGLFTDDGGSTSNPGRTSNGPEYGVVIEGGDD